MFMTNEKEAEKAIEEIKNYDNYPNELSKECRDYIIRTLKQQPCEFAISQQAAKNVLSPQDFIDGAAGYSRCIEEIDKLPLVTPVQKKGKWVTNPNKMKGTEIECNKCGVSALSKMGIQVCSKFCPNCGAKMERE